MGDVVHAVPVVEDIKRFISDAEIDWLVEDSFADIPRHVAGVAEVIECSVRKWKKRIFEKSTRDQIKALRDVKANFEASDQKLLKADEMVGENLTVKKLTHGNPSIRKMIEDAREEN